MSKDREIKTIMHSVKTRTLTVKKIEDITSHLRRVTLTGDELIGFTSLSPDDHIKIFFPYPGEEKPVVPVFGPDGPQTPDGRRPIMRDYTPRSYDENKKELEVEFFLHGEGPACSWAKRAQVGQSLTIGGPRGSRVVPYSFDWYLLVGDESAIPSFARRLEEVPSGTRAIAVIEVENPSQKIKLKSQADVEVHWIYREGRAPGEPEGFESVLKIIMFPNGDFFAWVAMERACAKYVKEFLISQKRANHEWIKASGYWIRESGDH